MFKNRVKKMVVTIVLGITVLISLVGCDDPVLNGAIDCAKEGKGAFACGLDETTGNN